MNISGIRPRASLYAYNSIKQNELRSRQITQARIAAKTKITREDEMETEVSFHKEKEKPSGVMVQERYVIDAVDSDVGIFYVKKAVAEWLKDTVLNQYQYFVGDQPVTVAAAEVKTSTVLRSGENFYL